jgi:hypothetical protein
MCALAISYTRLQHYIVSKFQFPNGERQNLPEAALAFSHVHRRDKAPLRATLFLLSTPHFNRV